MAKVPIHFMGFLANVDDSITRVRLPDGVVVEQKPYNEVSPFVDRIEFQYGFTAALHSRLGAPTGYFCITKHAVTEFEGVPGMSVIQRPFALMSGLADVPRDYLRLLRLFKEGNPIMDYGFLYHERNSGVEITNVGVEYPIADRGLFTLADSEIPEAQSFIEKYRLPLKEPSAQLAFESFDLSYEIHDTSLAFLSLMIAMEVLLHPGNRDELKYRICRNAGVLLGQDISKAEAIFGEMRSLYDKRSALVHSGNQSSVTRQDVLKLRQYVRGTIKEAMSSRMSKDELLKTLNACGFGQRPWREDAK